MNITEYIVESQRTMADVFHLNDEKEHRLLHGAIGIVTEIGELFEATNTREIDIVNVGEEIADVYWYLAIFQREYGFTLDCMSTAHLGTGYASMDSLMCASFVHSANLLDKFKKKAYYNRDMDSGDVYKLCEQLNYCMRNILDWIGIPLETVLQNNIDKLRVRFPDKFDNTFANVRNLDAERRELEK